MRIGERALEGMAVLPKARHEILRTGFEDFKAARVHGRERCLALDQMDRRAPFRSGFGEDKRSVVELEYGKGYTSRRLLVFGEPAEAPGDYEIQDEEQLALEFHDHSLSDSA